MGDWSIVIILQFGRRFDPPLTKSRCLIPVFDGDFDPASFFPARQTKVCHYRPGPGLFGFYCFDGVADQVGEDTLPFPGFVIGQSNGVAYLVQFYIDSDTRQLGFFHSYGLDRFL
jgi:hypothetical protein